MNAIERKILNWLADQLLPVGPWLKEKAKDYTPPSPSQWRAPTAKPSINDLDVAGFIEDLVTKPDPDAALAKRWEKLARHALALAPALPGRTNWRRGRKDRRGRPLLETRPKEVVFGAVASSNFILGEEEALGHGRTRMLPLTRHQLYRKCIPAFVAVVKARRLLDPDKPASAWARLFEDLQLTTGMPDWPADAPPALEFLRQFTKDAFWLASGFQRPKGDAFREVLPLEAGEHRRPGNYFGPPQVQATVTALEASLKLPAETIP